MSKRKEKVNAVSFRVRRKPPSVRPHASGVWTVCIGKSLNKSKSKLVPKNWYFSGTEGTANAQAAKFADRWAFMVKNWGSLYQPTLSAIGSPFADVPHWQVALKEKDGEAVSNGPTEADYEEYRNRLPSVDEIAEAYADVTLKGVFGIYKIDLKIAVANADKGKSTSWTDEKNVRCGMVFFDENMRLDALTATEIANAKTAMLAKLSRRSASNYLGAFKRMLDWFYNSDYGRGWEKPSNFDKAFFVRKKINTNVQIPTVEDMQAILGKGDDWERLISLLALNCGMYAADIGRLTLDELDLDKGYVFWDREKQPENPFRVRHDLWAETLELAKKLVQPKGTPQRFFADNRGHTPTQIDCSTLAFVDKGGNPLYRVRENGKAYSKIDKAWQRLNVKLKDAGGKQYQFHNLRKGTNQVLTDLLNNGIGDDERELIAIQEISKMFLGQKTPQLERLYQTRGVQGFGRLNKYLSIVGDELRKAGVFDFAKPKK